MKEMRKPLMLVLALILALIPVGATYFFTLILMVLVSFLPFLFFATVVTLIFAVPFFFAVTLPLELTFATFLESDLNFTFCFAFFGVTFAFSFVVV